MENKPANKRTAKGCGIGQIAEGKEEQIGSPGTRWANPVMDIVLQASLTPARIARVKRG